MTAAEKRIAVETLSRLLDDAPDYGDVGISIHFHNKALDRIEEHRGSSYKAMARGAHA